MADMSGRLQSQWTRLTPASHGKLHQRWRHSSGWELEHCGHPTAHWPWRARNPDRPEDLIVSRSGFAFPNLGAAANAVELLVSEAERAVPRVRLEHRRWAPQYGCHIESIVGVPGRLGSTVSRVAWAANRDLNSGVLDLDGEFESA